MGLHFVLQIILRRDQTGLKMSLTYIGKYFQILLMCSYEARCFDMLDESYFLHR